MPFQEYKKLQSKNYKKKQLSPNTSKNIIPQNDKKNIHDERVSSFTSKKASLTVEAALVLPIFIFAICFMMYFTEVVRVQAEIGNELYKQSKKLALHSYAYKQLDREKIIASGLVKDLAIGALNNLYVKSQIKKDLGDSYFNHNNIKNGISLVLSSYMKENDVIDIVVTYKITIPCNYFHLNKIRVIQRSRIRGWTGYEASGKSETQEEIVYITQNGSVYHRDASCTHINLSVSAVNFSDIGNLRNRGGGKYHECELCGGEENNGKVYITNTGDRYHNSRECSGIRRGIIAVPISQVGNRAPCSRCGSQ